MKIIIISLFFLTLFIKTYSQEKVVLYYNMNWEITKAEKAIYSREVEIDMGKFTFNGQVIDYDLGGKKIMEGYYTNGKKNGEFIFYFPNGKTESKGSYLNNRRTGNWEYFYSNGKLKQLVIINPKTLGDDIVVVEYFDRYGIQLVKNGTGKWMNDSIISGIFDRTNLKRLTGKFKDSLKVGEWKLVQISDNKLIHSERFTKGKFTSGTIMDPDFNYFERISLEIMPKFPDSQSYKFRNSEEFNIDTTAFPPLLLNADVATILKTLTGKEYEIKNRRVMYPEGDYSLLEFITQNIRYPISAQERKISGKVFIEAIIDSRGNLKETKILIGAHKDLDNEAIRVVQLIKKWLPELQNGIPVESSLTIPVSFKLN